MNETYEHALDTAQRELDELLVQQDQAERRISKLKLTIEGLKQLCDVESTIAASPEDLTSASLQIEGMGLTNLIRQILKSSQTPLSPTDIKEKLNSLGFATESYSNVMATIHVVLKRLVENKEAWGVKTGGKKWGFTYIPTDEQSRTRSVVSTTHAKAVDNPIAAYKGRSLGPKKKED